MSTRNKLWMIILFSLALIFVISKKNPQIDNMGNQIEDDPKPEMPSEVVILSDTPIKGEISQDDPPQTQVIIRSKALERLLGMTTIDLSAVQNRWNMNLIIRSSLKHCELGDLDLIAIDQKKRSRQGLLLTIEDLTQNKVLDKIQLTSDDLQEESIRTLSWPDSKSGRILGLFICSRSQRDDACQQKVALPINHGLDQPDTVIGQDRIYVFHYLHQDDKLSFLDPTINDPNLATNLQKVMMNRDLDQTRAARLSQVVVRWQENIGSASLQIKNQADLVLDLPRNDPKCPLPHLRF